MFTETFNTDWASRWYSVDSAEAGGIERWGIVNCKYYSSPYSMWVAGLGDYPHCVQYPGPMNTFLKGTTPTIIAGYVNVVVDWMMSLDINPNQYSDALSVFYSYDAVNWWYWATFRGYEYGYWYESENPIDVPGSGDSLYIAFAFQSQNPPSTGEGVYIDDIQVTGVPVTYPNLVPYHFSGMDDIIVVSSKQGTLTNDIVFEGEPIYVDIAIANIGAAKTNLNTNVYLLVDGVKYGSDINFPPLESGSGLISIDNQLSLTAGYHTIGITVDTFNVIFESDETDNHYERSIYVEEPSVTFKGYLYYLDPVPPDTAVVPISNIRIEMWDDDGVFDDSLGYYITESNGFFEIGPIENSDQFFTKLDPYFKIIPENEVCVVTNDSDPDDYSLYRTLYKDDINSGIYDTSITITIDSSAPFFIVNVISETYNKWIQYSPSGFPDKVQVELKNSNTTSYFNGELIHIETNVIPNTSYPHSFDRDIIIHEYGHFLQDQFLFFDTSFGGEHFWTSNLTRALGASEGFSDFLTNFIIDDSIVKHYTADFSDYYWYNSENGQYGFSLNNFGSANNYGDKCEAAIAGALWDIYDNADDDYSIFDLIVPKPPETNFYSPDGIGDTISLGVSEILNTLLGKEIDGHYSDDIRDFWEAWFLDPSYNHKRAMKDIFHDHGICCWGMRGNIDDDLDDIVDVSDLLLLVDYMFESAGDITLYCLDEADVNGDLVVDISDLNLLTDYMFSSPIPPGPIECSEVGY